MKAEYLRFVEAPNHGRKTLIVLVRKANSEVTLGRIAWYGRWRQYVFEPDWRTIYSGGCLAEIQQKVGSMMAERRAARRDGRT